MGAKNVSLNEQNEGNNRFFIFLRIYWKDIYIKVNKSEDGNECISNFLSPNPEIKKYFCCYQIDKLVSECRHLAKQVIFPHSLNQQI